ncbi:L-lysine 6-monooxygenase mbtG domain protein [Mycobacterium xenopi 3993]|nr:L-lysine 6-monooxygenase mbtG domain protein [Mycobacterium xenopi 3993]
MTLSTDRGTENLETVHGFDLVIDGSGADPLWFLTLFSQDALDLLELGLGGPLTGESLQEAIGYDLALTGVTPKLFLPNLAGLTQGPAFPTLAAWGCYPTACSVPPSPSAVTGPSPPTPPETMSTNRFDDDHTMGRARG